MTLDRRSFVATAASLAAAAVANPTNAIALPPSSAPDDPLGVRGDFPIVGKREVMNRFEAFNRLGLSAARTHPRAHGAEGRAPEHRSREAQRAACRSAAGRRRRQPLAAASAESEGP